MLPNEVRQDINFEDFDFVFLLPEQKQFVKDLAWNELKRISVDIEEFLRKHRKDDSKEIKKTEKQLLQEDK